VLYQEQVPYTSFVCVLRALTITSSHTTFQSSPLCPHHHSLPSSPTTLPQLPPSHPLPVYTDRTKIPLIVCGDFNSIPISGVCKFLPVANWTLPPDHADFMSHMYSKYMADGLRHCLGLKSTYARMGKLPLTNYTLSFQGAIDHVWYSTANLAVCHEQTRSKPLDSLPTHSGQF
jgi:CCR4-NOT transcription complex subunit 6